MTINEKIVSDSQEHVEVRQAIVEIDSSLLRHFFTKGWRGDGLECTDGLPSTARFVWMFADPYRNTVGLVFEDDSFSVVPYREAIPRIMVMYKKTYDESH